MTRYPLPMFTGGVTENDLDRALEQARRAEGPSEPGAPPSVVWAAGDGASYTGATPWGPVLDFVLLNSADLLAEGIGANVAYETMMRTSRDFQASGDTATPSFRASHDPGEPGRLIAAAAVTAVTAAAKARGFAAPPAAELLVVDRAVIRARGMVFHAFVLAGPDGSPFCAEAIVPLTEIRDIGIQTKIYPD